MINSLNSSIALIVASIRSFWIHDLISSYLKLWLNVSLIWKIPKFPIKRGTETKISSFLTEQFKNLQNLSKSSFKLFVLSVKSLKRNEQSFIKSSSLLGNSSLSIASSKLSKPLL